MIETENDIQSIKFKLCIEIENRLSKRKIKDYTVMGIYNSGIGFTYIRHYYKDFEKYEHLPEPCKCEETKKEYDAFWRNRTDL